MPVKPKKDYYKEIDRALDFFESGRVWHEKSIEWICNRINWCWKFRHITEDQMHELVNRVIAVM